MYGSEIRLYRQGGQAGLIRLELTLVVSQGKYTVTLIEGDGIGPEISQSVKDIFAAAKVPKGCGGDDFTTANMHRRQFNGKRLMSHHN
jgi:hypothetical protein